MTAQTDENTNIPQWTTGDRMMKALHHAGISVTEMAEYLEVSRNTIANWTSGRTPTPKMSLRLWALKTGVPLEWIESGEEKKDHPGGSGPEGQSRPEGRGPKQRTSDYYAGDSNVIPLFITPAIRQAAAA